MRQVICIEEAHIDAETEEQAKRIAAHREHKGHPEAWKKTEEHSFILQVRATSL